MQKCSYFEHGNAGLFVFWAWKCKHAHILNMEMQDCLYFEHGNAGLLYVLQVLRGALDAAGLRQVQIVAPDAPLINDWKICPDILQDPDLARAVSIVGYSKISL